MTLKSNEDRPQPLSEALKDRGRMLSRGRGRRETAAFYFTLDRGDAGSADSGHPGKRRVGATFVQSSLSDQGDDGFGNSL